MDKIKEYKYKNDTLIELLEITEDEQKHMITIISNNEYKRRENERGKKNYQEQLKAQGKLSETGKIKDLLTKGLKQQDICSKLSISKPTYVRNRNYLKRQGLI